MIEDKIDIYFADAYIEDDSLFGSCFEQNIFFQYNMKEKKLKWWKVFNQFKETTSFFACAIFKYREALYCFSQSSYEVVAYHLKNKIFMHFAPDSNLKKISVRCICRVGNEVWMLQEGLSSSVVVFSMENGQYSNYTLDMPPGQNIHSFLSLGRESAVSIDRQIWKCIPGSDALMVLDTKKLKSTIIKFGLQLSFFTMSYENGYFYILGMDGKHIVVWNQGMQKPMVWETGYKGDKNKPFREVIRIENRLFLLPGFEQKIFCYEIYDNQIQFICRLDYPIEFKRAKGIRRSLFFGRILRNQNELYLFPFGGNGMLCLEADSLKMRYYSIQIYKKDYISCQMQSKNLLYETQLDIGGLLEFLKLEIVDGNDSNRRKKNIGKKCWKKLRNLKL